MMDFIQDIQRPIGVSEALQKLTPKAKWYVENNNYHKLTWLEPPVSEGGQKKPTEEEVNQEIERLQVEYERNEYQRQRAPEYPDIKDQLDAIWKGEDAYEEMFARVMEVKAKYPKS
jgi:hypothetical protein